MQTSIDLIRQTISILKYSGLACFVHSEATSCSSEFSVEQCQECHREKLTNSLRWCSNLHDTVLYSETLTYSGTVCMRLRMRNCHQKVHCLFMLSIVSHAQNLALRLLLCMCTSVSVLPWFHRLWPCGCSVARPASRWADPGGHSWQLWHSSSRESAR